MFRRMLLLTALAVLPGLAFAQTWAPLQPHDNGLHYDPAHPGTGFTITVQDTGAGLRAIGQVLTFNEGDVPIWLVFDAPVPLPDVQFVHDYTLGWIGLARYTVPLYQPAPGAPAEEVGEVAITTRVDRGLTVLFGALVNTELISGNWHTVHLLHPVNPDPAPVRCSGVGFSPPAPLHPYCRR